MIDPKILYAVTGIVLLGMWVVYSIWSRLIEEVRDLRDELYEVRGRYEQIIKHKDEQYQALAEMRETTKIEDVMVTLERDIKAQNFRHEQEMMSTFTTMKNLLEKYVQIPFLEKRKTDSKGTTGERL